MTVDKVRLTNTDRQETRVARSSNLLVNETHSRDKDDGPRIESAVIRNQRIGRPASYVVS